MVWLTPIRKCYLLEHVPSMCKYNLQWSDVIMFRSFLESLIIRYLGNSELLTSFGNKQEILGNVNTCDVIVVVLYCEVAYMMCTYIWHPIKLGAH